MRIPLFIGLLGLAVCADNDIQGPDNFVHHGKHNSIKGKRNEVDGFDNKLIGKDNEVNGNKNSVKGNDNVVHGNDNLILGSGNFVFNGKDIEVDSDIDEEPSAGKEHSWAHDLGENMKKGVKSMKEEIQELTEGIRKKFAEKFHHKFTENMKKQFQDKFHSQSKLNQMNLEKLKKMKPSFHNL